MLEVSGRDRVGRELTASHFPGWIRRYIEVHSGTRFPLSYHALVGTFILTSAVGRRAQLPRDGYSLWPPTSILLLGHSGVGKSASLLLGREILAQAIDPTSRPTFIIDHALEYTPSSLIQEWRDRQDEMALECLEGIVTANELKAILKERTGNENASQFLIEACEHKDLTSKTVSRGTRTVHNLTVAFAFCSSLHYLRQSLTADEFGGGLMHRFLIAHEWKKAPIKGWSLDLGARSALAHDLTRIARDTPAVMSVDPLADSLLSRARELAEEKEYTSSHLSGFWNRFDAIIAKLALAFALADESRTILPDHVTQAREVIEGFLYPPMAALVDELSHGHRERRLFDLADNLALSGSRGVPLPRFLRDLPGANYRAKQEALATMEGLGLCKVRDGVVYRR